MSVQTAPCAWPVAPVCCAAWDDGDPVVKANAAAVATEILWMLSGRRFGVCPVTVRPCRAPCAGSIVPVFGPYYGGGSFSPHLLDGAWVNGCGTCTNDCGCGELCEVILPGPVDAVLEVKVDGLVIAPADYLVYDHRSLVRVDSELCWPYCQDLGEADTEPGTFSVRYGIGTPVPAAGLYAAGVYACELLKGCSDLPCRLPRRVTQITRQGITYSLLDPLDFLDKGLTGLYEVDSWIRAVNPAGLARGARVYSPDRRPPRRKTWP